MSLHFHTRVHAPTLILILIAATAVNTLACPQLALAQTTDGGGDNGCVLGPLCGLGDLGTWLQQTIQHIVSDFLSGLVKDFGNAIVGFINDINFLTHTPENLSYNDDLVKQFAMATQVLADGLLAVVVLVGGFNVMLRPYMGSTYAGVVAFLPRLLLGGILINTAAWWCRLAIDANNAACGVFGTPNIGEVLSAVVRGVAVPIAGLLMNLIVVVMAVLLVIQQLMRLALVDVLFILAPLAALLWILPQSQAWGRLWGRLFVGTVFAQAVQVLTLRLGFSLAIGLPPLSAAGLLQPLLGIAVLALALKIPSLMGGGAAGGNIVTSLLGTAAGAAVGTGVGIGVRAALGVGGRVVSRGAR
ncbi:MAG: conjugal transfer protein TrbL family protein [Chloroflexota bacterium]